MTLIEPSEKSTEVMVDGTDSESDSDDIDDHTYEPDGKKSMNS